MADVAQMAESISKETGLRTRVIGWYHSHPHITVLPSHIDVASQVWAPLKLSG
jgi:BRCA1/BRCA2-containing complex subunit 3